MVSREVRLQDQDIYLSMQEPTQADPPGDKPIMVGNLIGKHGDRLDMDTITFLPMWAIREITCWYTRHIGPMKVQRCSGVPDCGTILRGED